MQQGFFSVSTTCSRCHGSGRSVKRACEKCNGQARVRVYRKLKINIPQGIDSGSRLKLSREGEAGREGGPAGDLYIAISVRPHTFFHRSDDDVHCEVPISIVQAALGGEIVVPTLDGKVELKIPEGKPKIWRCGCPEFLSLAVDGFKKPFRSPCLFLIWPLLQPRL